MDSLGPVHITLVDDHDPAIAFFVDVPGFDLVDDSPSLTNDGRPKRWVVVRPPVATTGLLLARADGEVRAAAVGAQVAGRVGLFLRVEDCRVRQHPPQGVLRPHRGVPRRGGQPLGPAVPVDADPTIG